MPRTRRWALIAATAAALVVPAGRSEARPQEVEVRRDRFSPAEVRVEVDETVRWVIREEQHTITSDDGLFDSGRAGPGAIYVARFHNAGRYGYHCSVHGGPGGEGMSGVVVVRDKRREAASEESTTTTTAPPPAPTPPPPSPPPTTSPPPPSPSPPPPASPTAATAAAPTTSTSKPRPVTTTTAPAPPTTTTVTTVPPAPEPATTTAPPPPPPAPPAPPPDRYASGPVPEVPDPPAGRDLSRVGREATQRRLASATRRDVGDAGGSDALVIMGGGLLVVAGMVLVVPGWRTRRS